MGLQIRRLWISLILVVLLLVIVRRWIVRALLQVEKVKQLKRRDFSLAVKSVFCTLLLSLPIPVILGLAGRYLSQMGAPGSLTESLGNAARGLAPMALTVLFVRQLVRRHGFVEVFSDWPASSARALRHQVVWLVWLRGRLHRGDAPLCAMRGGRQPVVFFFVFFLPTAANPTGRVMPILAMAKPEETQIPRRDLPVTTWSAGARCCCWATGSLP
jgi:hypothetical protein